MSKALINIPVVKVGENDEVLATVQIAGNANLDSLRREVAAKLSTDPRVSLQMVMGDKYLLGPGSLQEHGVTNKTTVGVTRKRGLVVTGSADHTAMVWCGKSGKTTFILKGHTDVVHASTFSPDNKFIATGSADKKTKIWTLENGQCVATLEEHKGVVASTAFSPEGTLLLTGSLDKTAKLWRLPAALSPSSLLADGAGGAKDKEDKIPECVITLAGHEDGVTCAEFSPTGTFIATGSEDGTAKVWAVKDGVCWATMQGHGAAVRGVGFSPDNQLLVTASQDMTAKVWNAVNGACKLTLEGHRGFVTASSFSPDGRFIVTASRDKLAKLWCPKSGRCLHTLDGHEDGLYAARFAHNSRFVVTGASDKKAKVWSLVDDKVECSVTVAGHHEGVRSAACSSMWANPS